MKTLNLIPSRAKDTAFDRIAIFACYFPKGIVRRHTLYYLDALVRSCSQVLVVVNGEVNEDGKSKILELTPYLLVRENVGFDIWGYKEGLEWFGWERIQQSSELLLTNCTCYGPVYPLEDVFSVMEQRNCDFWGMVKHPKQDNYLLFNHRGYINEYIMSYFMIIRHDMLNSPYFQKYWQTLPMMSKKEEAFGLHEVVFTKYFEERGFKSDAYVDLAKYEGRVNNSSIFLANELLIEDRCPLVKRCAFFFPSYHDLRAHETTDQACELFEFLQTQTDYDVSMIWEDLLANERFSLIRQNMHLTQVIDEKGMAPDLPAGKCICSVVYVPDNAHPRIYAQLIRTLEKICANIDVYYTSERTMRELAQLGLVPHSHLSLRKIEDGFGFGRILRCIELSKDMLLRADYVFALLHIDETDKGLRIDNEDSYRFLIQNLAGTTQMIASILRLFENDSFLGLVNAFPCSFGNNFSRNQMLLQNRMKCLRKLHEACSFSFPFDEDVEMSEGAFWTDNRGIRSIVAMLDKLASENFTLDGSAFNYLLPRFIQAGGLHALRVISSQKANVELDNLRYDVQRIKQELAAKGLSQWDAYGTQMAIRRLNVFDRKTLVRMPYRLREIFQIVKNYPEHKLNSMLGEKRVQEIKRRFKKKATAQPVVHAHATLMNITEENGRILFFFSSSEVDFNRCKLMCGKKKSYALKRLEKEKWDVIDYCRATGRYAAFFSVPVEWVRNNEIRLMFDDDLLIGLQWVFAISYNALELKQIGLYFRLENKILYCQTREVFVAQVMKSPNYSVKEKLVFTFARFNPFHPLTIMAENLNAGDNTYQLFRYALQKKESVYYVCSKETYDSHTDPAERAHMLVHNSRKHKLAMLFAQRWIGSYSLRRELLPTIGVLKDIHYCMLPTHWIFVPHGITLPDKTAYMLSSYNSENPEQTFTCSEKEKKCFAGYYGYKNVFALGAPRMDKWANAKIEGNDVLFFFTWREVWSRYGKGREQEQFRASPYYHFAVEAVKAARQAYPDRRISYIFHHEVQRCGFDEEIRSALSGENVEFISFSNADGARRFNEAFYNARYLVTDFSSVAYDFSYKPDGIAIYYQPDQFVAGHYEVDPALFNQLHLGIVAQTPDELLACLGMAQRTDEMIKRREEFFLNLNGENAQRVYQAIFHGHGEALTLPSLPDKTEKRQPKRLCIYFFYDEEGIVDRYVTYYLRELRTCCQEICVVVNGCLTVEGRKALQAVSDTLIVRENIGFDSSAYKEAILHYGFEHIAQEYDELVLNNFTNFGPVYPFEEMFATMDDRDCDLWGHAFYYAEGTKIGGVKTIEHLMSYFIVFRAEILKSQSFEDYWNTLKIADNYLEAVIFHEMRCTEYFTRQGFVADAFIDSAKYYNQGNIAVCHAYSLLTEDRSLLLKRKVFIQDKDRFAFDQLDGHNGCEIMQYLVEHTDYDPMMIMENIGRIHLKAENMTVSEYAACHEKAAFNRLMEIIRTAQKRKEQNHD